jgi:hypothetical protein
LCGGDNIEGDLDAISSNPVASTIPTWRTFKLLKWVQILKRVVDLDEMMYGGDDIKKELDSIRSNPVPSTIPKWRTFKHLRLVYSEGF